jgi:hypothetical protein
VIREAAPPFGRNHGAYSRFEIRTWTAECHTRALLRKEDLGRPTSKDKLTPNIADLTINSSARFILSA